MGSSSRSEGPIRRSRVASIARYWNAAVAAGALVVVLVFTVTPPLQQYVGAAGLVAAFAALSLLIDIRVELDKELAARSSTVFVSMRAARPEISRRLLEVVKTGGDLTEVAIIGGRIRTITDIVRDVADQLGEQSARRRTVNIRIASMAPVFLEQLELPGQMPTADQLERNKSYASSVQAAVRELRSIAAGVAFTSRGIRVQVVEYAQIPAYYCFLIDRKYLFWGFFTWDDRTSDVIGPANPCFYMSAKHPEFDYMYDSFSNRVALMEAQGPVNRDVAASEQPAGRNDP